MACNGPHSEQSQLASLAYELNNFNCNIVYV